MAEDNEAPKLGDVIREKAYLRWGMVGVVLIALLSTTPYVLTNWDKLTKFPGVGQLVTRLTQAPVPKADPTKFSIMVAHLENDANREYERLVVESLKEHEGIGVCLLDRTIPVEGPVPEEVERLGHASAHSYLEQSGATVLIWGTVIARGGKSIPKLYWTSRKSDLAPKRYDAPAIEEQLRMPEVFWSDLSRVLQLAVATSRAEFDGMDGHYFADRLLPFILRTNALLEGSSHQPGWDADARGETRLILGTALGVFGAQSGQKEPLVRAAAVFREALNDWTRERAPGNWAGIQCNLGITLTQLGEWENDTEHFTQAISCFREALTIYARDRTPLQWAKIHSNLGVALCRLGERENGAEHLKEAVSVYHEALQEWTFDRAPLMWSITKNNLGLTLFKLGVRQNNTDILKKAVSAFREALKVQTRERVPLEWAPTQNNLGLALWRLGERENDTDILKKAVSAFREALKEQTRERNPRIWADIQNSLGNALVSLGEREKGASLEDAVFAFREALQERTREGVPLAWATTQHNLGLTLWMLGGRENDSKKLKEAVFAFREALKVQTRERVPLEWAKAKNNLGLALKKLGGKQNDTESLKEAISAFRDALKIYTRDSAPLQWATVQFNLGLTLSELSTLLSGPIRLQCANEAIQCHDNALSVTASENDPKLHRRITHALYKAVQARDNLGKNQ